MPLVDLVSMNASVSHMLKISNFYILSLFNETSLVQVNFDEVPLISNNMPSRAFVSDKTLPLVFVFLYNIRSSVLFMFIRELEQFPARRKTNYIYK